jgi:protein-L-isoaspartate(D-aspartate) O-methyltransferase
MTSARNPATRTQLRLSLRVASLLTLAAINAVAHAADDHESARRQMLREIERTTVQTARDTGRRALDARVLSAMDKVQRHLFVPAAQQRYAYENRPLPIGHGQTISQPYIVALMTDLMRVERDDVVLEIGTGSGYQAAVLAELAKSVFSIEIVEPLGKAAHERLQRLGYRQVDVKVADGYYGWPEHAPFDAIMVTAAASHVPPPLVRQLKRGGRMIIPVGTAFLTQHLMLVEKQRDGSVVSRQILPVQFVPLTGGH